MHFSVSRMNVAFIIYDVMGIISVRFVFSLMYSTYFWEGPTAQPNLLVKGQLSVFLKPKTRFTIFGKSLGAFSASSFLPGEVLRETDEFSASFSTTIYKSRNFVVVMLQVLSGLHLDNADERLKEMLFFVEAMLVISNPIDQT